MSSFMLSRFLFLTCPFEQSLCRAKIIQVRISWKTWFPPVGGRWSLKPIPGEEVITQSVGTSLLCTSTGFLLVNVDEKSCLIGQKY